MGSDPLDLDVIAGAKFEPGNNDGADRNGLDSASWRKVFGYAYALAGNKADAEDLTQEAFAEFLRARAAGKLVMNIGAWMRTVTKRLAYRSYRERRPDLHTSFDTVTDQGEHLTWEPPDTRPSPEQCVIDQSMVRLSAKVLSQYSDRERECVLMYFRGYNFTQIASVLGVSRWTARRLALEMVKRVRAELQLARKR